MLSNASVSVSAKIANDPTPNPQVNWTATCNNMTGCGSFNPYTTGSEVTTTYTSPYGLPLGDSIIVTATSVADPIKSISATILINPPVSVAFYSTVPASLPTDVSIPLSAIVSYDPSAIPQVQWSVTCDGSTCGSFSSTTTATGKSTTYTTPSTVPAGGAVTVTATSVTDPTKSVSASIPIVAAVPNPSLPDGSYVFQIYGADGTAVAGVFKAVGGYIVGGEEDFSSSADPTTGNYDNAFGQISGGSYTTSADGNLQISLQYPDGSSLDFESSPAPHGRGFIAGEFSYAQYSGTLNLQTSAAPPAGGYAVSLQGSDVSDDQVWLGGVLNIDMPVGLYSPGGISGSGSVLDVHYYGHSSDDALTVGAGMVSSPDQYGRVVIQLNASAPSASESFYLAGYPVDATHMALIETVDGATGGEIGGVMSGVALGQGSGTGKFNANSISGSSYVFDAGGSLIVAGVVTAQNGGSLTGTLNWNNGSGTSTQSPLPFTGTYAVDPTGRVTLSNLSGAGFSYNMYLYLTGNGQGLVLSNDSADAFLGEAIQQQTTPFTANSLNGQYELNTSSIPFLAAGPAVIGTVTASTNSGTNSLAGVGDSSNNKTGIAISGDFTPASNGVLSGTFTGLNPYSSTTTGNFTLYLADGTQGFAIETDNSVLNLVHLQVP